MKQDAWSPVQRTGQMPCMCTGYQCTYHSNTKYFQWAGATKTLRNELLRSMLPLELLCGCMRLQIAQWEPSGSPVVFISHILHNSGHETWHGLWTFTPQEVQVLCWEFRNMFKIDLWSMRNLVLSKQFRYIWVHSKQEAVLKATAVRSPEYHIFHLD